MFIKMLVTRPAMLFKNAGLPQLAMRKIILRVNCGRQKRSFICPSANGASASTAQIIMPRQVPSAAAQMPQPNTARNKNSSPALRPDIRMLRYMLPLICPQMRR